MNKNYRSISKSKANLNVAVLKKTVSKSKKNRTFNRLNSLTAKVAHTASVALIALLSGHALATDCKNLNNVPVSTPTLGDDVTFCRSGTLSNWNDLGGDDQLQLGNITGDFILDGSIQMGAGSDQLHLTKYQDTGFEFITTNSSSIDMGAGDDYLWLYSYPAMNWTFNAVTNLGTGNDWLLITDEVVVGATINGGDGNDQFGLGASAIYDGEGATQGASAPIINADIFGDAGDDTFWISKGAIVNGTLDGGSGNDFFMLRKGSAQKVNGNTGNDSFTLEGTFNHADSNLILDGGADDDSIRFEGVVGSVKAENIRNFETILVANSSKLNLTGAQLTLGSAHQDALVNILSGSELSFGSNIFTIAGGKGILNSGTLNLRGATPGKTLFINGSYAGTAGSQILFNTQLGKDNSLTDRLVVTGNTSGESQVFVKNVGGTGAKTINGINLIEVQGNSDAVFTLGSPVQVGTWEYFLTKSGNNWNLESSGGGGSNSITPDPTDTPSSTSEKTPGSALGSTPKQTPSSSPKIYRPAVAGYLQAAQAQFDQNANLIGTLEQRQASINNTGDVWGRVIADKSSKKTSTFGYQQSSQTLQFGKDIIDTKSGQGNQTKAGVTIGLGQQSSSYSDQIRAFTSTGINTGASETTEFALGAYYTQRNEVNPYTDLQAHIVGSSTKFNDVYDGSAKQTGLGVVLSAELGKDIALGKTGLDITPQAQAVYQNHSYSDFNDATSDVAKQNAESLRVRAGITLTASKAKLAANDTKTSWNASINVLQEVVDNPSRTVAGNVVNADNQQKPWLEVGVGLNHQLNEASSLAAQISHKRSISGNQQSGNSVNIAYRLKW